MAKDDSTEKQGTFRRLIEAYRITKRTDKHIGLICLAWVLARRARRRRRRSGSSSTRSPASSPASPSGVLAALIVFGRRAERAAYAQLEGQPGAAAAALGVLKRGWKVQNAVAVTKNQDLVHRVVGRPGVILVGEGNEARVRHLLGVEKKKHARVVGETPIYDIVVGDRRRGRRADPQAVEARREAAERNIKPGRGHRRAPAAEGARRDASADPDAQGPDADEHEAGPSQVDAAAR